MPVIPTKQQLASGNKRQLVPKSLLLLRMEVSRTTSQTEHPKLSQRQGCKLTDARLLLIDAQQNPPLIPGLTHGLSAAIRSYWGFLWAGSTCVRGVQPAGIPAFSNADLGFPALLLKTCADDLHLLLRQAFTEQEKVFCYNLSKQHQSKPLSSAVQHVTAATTNCPCRDLL